MELAYTTEKSENETIRLFLRRNKFFKALHEVSVCFAFVWPLASVFILIYSSCIGLGRQIAFLGISILALGFGAFLIDRLLTRKPRRAYRQRGTGQIEYRLTDDGLSFTAGETQFFSPWNKVAKKFRIDKKAIYLYGKNLPFEAQCIPDWNGHGVEKKELVATLKRAGLKKAVPYGLKSLLFNGFVVVALMTYVYVGGSEWGDWTIPNEEGLRLVAKEVPDVDNAWLALHALTNICTIIYDRSHDDKGFVRNYGMAFAGNDSEVQAVRSDPASPERAAKILAANEKFFVAFQTAMSRKGFFDKELAARDRASNDGNKTEFPTNSCWQGFQCFVRFAQLVALKSQIALENGDIDAAISDIGDIHALGQMISTNSMLGRS